MPILDRMGSKWDSRAMEVMSKELTWEHTKQILPEVQKAEELYWEAVRSVETDADYEKITKDFNAILDKAIEAIYEDTKDRNSKSKLEQIFKSRGKYDTHFGVQPTKHIMEFMRLEPDDSNGKSGTD